jgi:hypothetical protein
MTWLSWGLGVEGLGFGVWGLEFTVWGLGFGIWNLRFGVWGLGFGIWGWGLGVGASVVHLSAIVTCGIRLNCGGALGHDDHALDVARGR